MEKELVVLIFYSLLVAAFGLSYGMLDGHNPGTGGPSVRPAEEKQNLIDKLVKEGTSRYLSLEKANAVHGEGSSQKKNVASNFKTVIIDCAAPSEAAGLEDQENHPRLGAEGFVTLKPGSIIKDVVPSGSIILMEAPYIPVHMNLSDQAFQEDGEVIDMQLETDKMKTYTGAEAVKRLHTSESFPDSNTTDGG